VPLAAAAHLQAATREPVVGGVGAPTPLLRPRRQGRQRLYSSNDGTTAAPETTARRRRGRTPRSRRLSSATRGGHPSAITERGVRKARRPRWQAFPNRAKSEALRGDRDSTRADPPTARHLLCRATGCEGGPAGRRHSPCIGQKPPCAGYAPGDVEPRTTGKRPRTPRRRARSVEEDRRDGRQGGGGLSACCSWNGGPDLNTSIKSAKGRIGGPGGAGANGRGHRRHRRQGAFTARARSHRRHAATAAKRRQGRRG